jgi:hypothetical protein
MRRWEEYFAEFLNGPDNEEQEQETLDYYGPAQQTEKRTLPEVEIINGKLKNNKAQKKTI